MVRINGLDVERVSRWLESTIADCTAPFEFELIEGGRSNLTFRVTDAFGSPFVVRRPPLGDIHTTAHDMIREHRIISALGGTQVPIPRALGCCTDVSVTGTPFFAMAWVDGVVLDGAERAQSFPPGLRAPTSFHLIDVLADLHDVNVDAVGLGDLAKRDGYVHRQIRRWSEQWRNFKTRELSAVDDMARRLIERIPEQRGVSIVHGDYRFGNCMADVVEGRITSVLDWELCTLGDPYADLGQLAVYWSDDDNDVILDDPSAAGGFPTFAEIVGRYGDRTGRDVSNIGYYVAFSCWRLAVMSEGIYARHLQGAFGEQRNELSTFRATTEQLAERALNSWRRLA